MLELTLDPVASNLADGVDAQTIAASQAVAQQIAATDWLGPLAPIALSPFFGLAILSGAATYGPDWLDERSALFADGSTLNNPWLFWSMLTLAILTSLPRLTKVSKPIALAADNLEAYSAIIILAVVRFCAPSGQESVEVATPLLEAAGIASIPFDLVMIVFAGINVLVINLIKLFFEFLVLIIPFPTIDAMLEAGNKAVCGILNGAVHVQARYLQQLSI